MKKARPRLRFYRSIPRFPQQKVFTNSSLSIFSYVAFFVALVSLLGSLYFSEIRHFPPCILCWYQRIAMYPLVFILGIGILRRDKGLFSYVLPFSLIGIAIAIYHNLLYYHILPDSIAPCVQGISCTTKFIEFFGFVTIPFLSLIAFVIITLCMVFVRKK